jgi:uridine kinase
VRDVMARRILIGIAGGSGSGKTLVARTIVREIGSDRVVIIDQDSYYKNLDDIPFLDREARNPRPPRCVRQRAAQAARARILAGRSVEQPDLRLRSTGGWTKPGTSANTT